MEQVSLRHVARQQIEEIARLRQQLLMTQAPVAPPAMPAPEQIWQFMQFQAFQQQMALMQQPPAMWPGGATGH